MRSSGIGPGSGSSSHGFDGLRAVWLTRPPRRRTVKRKGYHSKGPRRHRRAARSPMKRQSDEASPPNDPRQARGLQDPPQGADARPPGPGRGAGRARPGQAHAARSARAAGRRHHPGAIHRAHEGRRRQMQYIGKLMRDIDPEPVREAARALRRGPALRACRVRSRERWRRGCCTSTMRSTACRRSGDRSAARGSARARTLTRARVERSPRARARRFVIASSSRRIRLDVAGRRVRARGATSPRCCGISDPTHEASGRIVQSTAVTRTTRC